MLVEMLEKRRTKKAVQGSSLLPLGWFSSKAEEETKDATGNAHEESNDDIKNVGPSGWLHRENELSIDDPKESPWIRMFVVLENRYLIYTTSDPKSGKPIVGDGYLHISNLSYVKSASVHKIGVTSSSSLGKHCFSVKEQNDTENATQPLQVTFSASSEEEKNVWINAITDASNGVEHQQPASINLRFDAATSTTHDTSNMELPRKIGPLRKYAVGGLMNLKTVKSRWFRLDGGELRYYASEDMRPSKLKGTLSLRNGKVIHTPENPISIIIQVEIPGEKSMKQLHMEASNPGEAKQWRDAFQETFLALRVRATSGGNKRRLNLADVGESQEEKKERRDLLLERQRRMVEVTKVTFVVMLSDSALLSQKKLST